MSFVPFKKVSMAVVGDDLHVVRVSGSAAGVRVRRGPLVRGFAGMGAEEARRALAGVVGGGRVVLTLTSGSCGVRPMPLGVRRWASARGEVVRSIGRLFPLEPDDAAVGLIERTAGGAAGEGDARGYVVAASRREVEHWTGLIERAMGTSVGEVLSTEMAMLGLGLQHEARVGVIERAASGGEEIHWLRYGEVEELGAVWSNEMDDTAEIGGAVLRRLPGAGGGVGDGADEVDGFEIAIGAALAPVVAGGRFAPLVGRAPSARQRWIAPVAGAAAAALLLWTAGIVLEGRYERGIARFEAERAAMDQDLTRVQALRRELGEKTALLEEGVGKTVAGWHSVMPDLEAAHTALPPEAFLYEVSIEGDRVFVRGEAPRASEVLRALESSDRFDGPRMRSPVRPVAERSTEEFDLVARRAGAGTDGGGS